MPITCSTHRAEYCIGYYRESIPSHDKGSKYTLAVRHIYITIICLEKKRMDEPIHDSDNGSLCIPDSSALSLWSVYYSHRHVS